MLDRLKPVLHKLLEDWPEIKAPRVTEILRDDHGYQGSVDLVRRRLGELRPPKARPAQRTGYRPGQVLQLDWAERPRIGGRERRLRPDRDAALSGAQSAHFSFDMTAESFLEGHTRLFDWLGGVPKECVYDNLRTVAKRDRDEIRWNQRFLHLRGHYAFHATACTPASPPEQVGGTAAQQEQAGEGEGVGTDHPLQPLLEEAQRLLYRGQRDNDDVGVEGSP